MFNLKDKRIIIFQQRNWAMNIGHPLAKKLQAEGCELAAITLKNSTHEFIKNQKDVNYKFIVGVDEILENPDKFLTNDGLTLKKICDELGIGSIWPLIHSNRLLVKSYRDKFYYSFRQNVSDEFIIKYIKAFYSQFKNLVINFKPDAIFIYAFIYEGHAILSLLADLYKIPIIAITDAKISGYFIFSYDYLNNRGPFFNLADDFNNNKIENQDRIIAKKYISEFRKKFIQPTWNTASDVKKTFWKKIKHELSPYYHIFHWYIDKPENYIASLGATPDYRPPKIILRDFYCYKRYKKFADNFKYYSFDKIEKYIYFPLQFQPEGQIDLLAPYFSNQIEVARQLAMSLPDDYTLVVKEHPQMVGYRSPEDIGTFSRLPNVKLINYRISNEKVINGSSLIISPGGTTLAEAAFLRKPAIQLGDLGTTLKLPNVFKHTDITTLTKKIKQLLAVNLNNDEYERKLENYVAAVFAVGFNLDYIKIWEGKGRDILDEQMKLLTNEIRRAIETNEAKR